MNPPAPRSASDRLRSPTNQAVGLAAAHLVAAEVLFRGARDVHVERVGQTARVRASSRDRGREVVLRVKAKRRGDWQTTTTHARRRRRPADETSFWVLVDLEPSLPTFRVVPAWWLENDIHREHQDYLSRHGGQRAETPNSDHHRIQPSRVAEFQDGWLALGIFS
jgi:hypothetical protein